MNGQGCHGQVHCRYRLFRGPSFLTRFQGIQHVVEHISDKSGKTFSFGTIPIVYFHSDELPSFLGWHGAGEVGQSRENGFFVD